MTDTPKIIRPEIQLSFILTSSPKMDIRNLVMLSLENHYIAPENFFQGSQKWLEYMINQLISQKVKKLILLNNEDSGEVAVQITTNVGNTAFVVTFSSPGKTIKDETLVSVYSAFINKIMTDVQKNQPPPPVAN